MQKEGIKYILVSSIRNFIQGCMIIEKTLFVKGGEMHKLKAKDSKINAAPLCLRNVSKDFLANNMKKLDFMVIFTILV